MKKLRGRIGLIIGWIVAFAIILVLLFSYSIVVGDRLYEDAKRNFSEVYQQVDRNYLSFMNDAWKNLSDWGPYIHSSKDNAAAEYIEERKNIWGFTDFLFINENGDCINAMGTKQHIDLGESETRLFKYGTPIMSEIGLDSSTPMTVFARRSTQGTYKGFQYQAMAIAFSNFDLASTIKTDSFAGQCIGFVVYPDGTIAFSTQEGGSVFSNYLTYLSAGSNLTKSQIDDLRYQWEKAEKGVQILTLNNTEYYLSYMPLGYDNLMLLGIVPSVAVSGEIRNVQEITADVMLKIFLILTIIIAIQIIYIMRHRTKKRQSRNRISRCLV